MVITRTTIIIVLHDIFCVINAAKLGAGDGDSGVLDSARTQCALGVVLITAAPAT